MKFIDICRCLFLTTLLVTAVGVQAKNAHYEQYKALKADIFKQAQSMFAHDAGLSSIGVDSSYYSSICARLNQRYLPSDLPLRYSGEWVPVSGWQNRGVDLDEDIRLHLDGRRLLLVKPQTVTDTISHAPYRATNRERRQYRIPNNVEHAYRFHTAGSKRNYVYMPGSVEEVFLFLLFPGLFIYEDSVDPIVGLDWSADHANDRLYFYNVGESVIEMRRSNRCQCEHAAKDLALLDYTAELFLRESDKFLLAELKAFKDYIVEFEAKEADYKKKLFNINSIRNAVTDLFDTYHGQRTTTNVSLQGFAKVLGRLNGAINLVNQGSTLFDMAKTAGEAKYRQATLFSIVNYKKRTLINIEEAYTRQHQTVMRQCSDYYNLHVNQKVVKNQAYKSQVFDEIKLFVPLVSPFFSAYQVKAQGGQLSVDQPSIQLSH